MSIRTPAGTPRVEDLLAARTARPGTTGGTGDGAGAFDRVLRDARRADPAAGRTPLPAGRGPLPAAGGALDRVADRALDRAADRAADRRADLADRAAARGRLPWATGQERRPVEGRDAAPADRAGSR
ncbi:hypothetical protein ACFQL5_12285, partial [Aquipuribacter hungaricus]